MSEVVPLASTSPQRRANKAGLAEFFGVSPNAIDGWIRRGCPVVERGGMHKPWVFDVLEVAQWRFAGPVSEEADFDPDRLPPADRDKWFASELKRRTLQVEDGQLLRADEVRATWAEVLKTIVLSLDTLADVVERDASLSPEQAQVVQRVVDRQRDMLHRSLTTQTKESCDETTHP